MSNVSGDAAWANLASIHLVHRESIDISVTNDRCHTLIALGFVEEHSPDFLSSITVKVGVVDGKVDST